MKVKMGMMLCRTFSWKTNRNNNQLLTPPSVKIAPGCVCAAYREDGGGAAQQQQSVVMGLRHIGRSDALDHQLHAEFLFIQDVCKENHTVDEKTEVMRRTTTYPERAPTCSHCAPMRRQPVADIEQTAEQQLFGVLHVGVLGRAWLQTPEDIHRQTWPFH